MAAVVAEDVRKRYGDVVALDGVSLSVEEGEVFGLIGPNGAGKTTLTRALTGTTRVDGRVSVLGSPPAEVDPQRVGLLPQAFDPPARLTARELLDYYGGLYEEARPTAEVLADVGLADAADTWYEDLSGGQKRRVCVGTALVNDPDVLFLDEPTTGIDPAGRRDVWGLVEELAAGGATVALTTHDMAEAERLADRVGLLADGRLVAAGAPSDLVAEHGGRPRLELGVDDEPAARRALDAAGYELDPAATDPVVADVDARAVARVAEVLEDAGVGVEELVWRRPDLESVYLSLAGDDAAGEGASVDRREASAEVDA